MCDVRYAMLMLLWLDFFNATANRTSVSLYFAGLWEVFCAFMVNIWFCVVPRVKRRCVWGSQQGLRC